MSRSTTTSEPAMTSRYGRRDFLKRVGLGASAVAAARGISVSQAAVVQPAHARSRFLSTAPQHFGRIFPHPEPFAPATRAVTKSLVALGAQGGPIDAVDQRDRSACLLGGVTSTRVSFCTLQSLSHSPSLGPCKTTS